jgi:hypothetical protein
MVFAVWLIATGLAGANAQTVGSSYTSTAPKDCRSIGKPSELDGSASRLCRGKGNLVVLISEDDLRETVSVGRNRNDAARQPASDVWFGPFNSSETTIEWRSLGARPFAMIQRWHIADHADREREDRPRTKAMLVVSRLPPGAVCHVAYVDAIANGNANELARQAADELARDFDCGKDQVKIVGARGRAIELATAR